jgi:hypothetical protein
MALSGIVDLPVSKTVEVRAYVRPNLRRLLKAIAGLKNSGKDWTVSDCIAVALFDWLLKPENQALINEHNLKQLFEEVLQDSQDKQDK